MFICGALNEPRELRPDLIDEERFSRLDVRVVKPPMLEALDHPASLAALCCWRLWEGSLRLSPSLEVVSEAATGLPQSANSPKQAAARRAVFRATGFLVAREGDSRSVIVFC